MSAKKMTIALVLLSLGLAAGGFQHLKGGKEHAATSPVSSAAGRIRADENNLQREAPAIPAETISLLFGGDLMLDRYLRQVAMKKGYDFLFEKVGPLLSGSDLSVLNLEGPITDYPSVSLASEFGSRENYIFTFDPVTAGVLKKHHVGLVSLGNNHILNFNEDGARQTEKYLAESGTAYFGSPVGDGGARFAVKDFAGFKIAFVNYNQFAYRGKEAALEDIAGAKQESGLVVLYAHWGKEYETEPLESVKDLARQFVDAGADLIIGSHPHVVQGKEIYKGKTIYYSLGNFIFDQYFEDRTKEGLAVKVTVDPASNSMHFEEIKLRLATNGQTAPEE